MEPFITKQTLVNADVDISEVDEKALLEHLNLTLNERIGAEVVESLDDVKLKELLVVQEAGDDSKVGDWLKQNVEELDEIVQDEIDILIGELTDNAEGINDAPDG